MSDRNNTLDERAVRWFALKMRQKLHANEHKGSWRQSSADWLLARLQQEVAELDRALCVESRTAVILECADVANFAMMIADNMRQKSKET